MPPTTTTIRPERTDHQQRDQDKTLQAVLATVAQQLGPAIVTSPNGDATTPPAVIGTGSLALDHALGVGGIPGGRITEVYGPEGVGKTTFGLSVIAQAQRAGGTGLFIDAEHALDLSWAATCGVDTHRLLLCQPESGEQALQVASLLITSGAVDVVVVDSIAGLVPEAELRGRIGEAPAGAQGNLLSQALRRLAGQIARAQVAVVATNQLRQRAGVPGQQLYTAGGRALGYYDSVRLHLHQPQPVKQDGQVLGARVRVQVVKNKLASAWQACELEVHRDHGLSAEAGLVDLGLELGLLAQRGGWITYGTVRLGQGHQTARRHLREHPELASQLDRELRARLRAAIEPTVEPAAS
jgi:recombination protein RecA